ncbi:ATP phosphoribosyltransferase regulatory subunit [Heyndrickxia ginsengihumi]|uniref:ATP phosphoribosyltransferase regulatory subunit n=1 Tax=Heyndrickxia ginsengihumi TaxID=363870 RepID=UPI000470F855|nr:ATP phosphoribosyltransferase regulatory subunit [Heyndrickxia ginsengihumi]MCM3024736.1 ATP phosphoribosyltransferase regulatory subunit [Heyndrickxia ginsengihumi]
MFLPEGSKDDIGQVVANRFKVFETFRQVALSRNYTEISTPLVEYADTFTNDHVGMSLQNMLKWFNRDGAIEVLRPDWTTSISRALTNHHMDQHKWAYHGSIFRQEIPGVESRQVGIEIVQLPALLGESECLFLAYEFLNQLQINDVIVELGHTGIFEEWVTKLNLSEEQVDRLRNAMHDKRKDEVYEIAKQNGHEKEAEVLATLVDAYGPFEMIDEYFDRWEDQPKLISILKHIKQLGMTLRNIGIEDLIIDLGRVKNLPYYTGTLFRGFLKQNGATCFSGGRYDKLYDRYQLVTSAVGIAFDVDILAEQIRPEMKMEKICIIANDEALAYAEKHRQSLTNKIVDIRYDIPKTNQYDEMLIIMKKDDNKWEVTSYED